MTEDTESLAILLHTLFCSKSHSNGDCKFLFEESIVDAFEQPEHKKWKSLAETVEKIFSDDVEAFLDFLPALARLTTNIKGGKEKVKMFLDLI